MPVLLHQSHCWRSDRPCNALPSTIQKQVARAQYIQTSSIDRLAWFGACYVVACALHTGHVIWWEPVRVGLWRRDRLLLRIGCSSDPFRPQSNCAPGPNERKTSVPSTLLPPQRYGSPCVCDCCGDYVNVRCHLLYSSILPIHKRRHCDQGRRSTSSTDCSGGHDY